MGEMMGMTYYGKCSLKNRYVRTTKVYAVSPVTPYMRSPITITGDN